MLLPLVAPPNVTALAFQLCKTDPDTATKSGVDAVPFAETSRFGALILISAPRPPAAAAVCTLPGKSKELQRRALAPPPRESVTEPASAGSATGPVPASA